jgi:integrase
MGPRVSAKAPCAVCGDEDPGDAEATDMVFCDGKGCRRCFHLSCLRPVLLRRPEGAWLCPSCQKGRESQPAPRPAPLGAPRSTAAPQTGASRPLLVPKDTFNHLIGKTADRASKRQRLGQGSKDPPTREDLARFLALARADNRKYEQVWGRFESLCGEEGWDPKEIESQALYVLWRVRNGVSAKTVGTELSQIRHRLGQVGPYPVVVRDAMRAAEKMADVPQRSKLPLSLGQLRQLKAEIDRQPQQYALRDWAYYLLAFVGFFRGSELVALEWSHLHFVWLDGEQEYLTRDPEPPSARARCVAVHVDIVESKTDQKGQGQAVRIAAASAEYGSGFDLCPIALLGRLWRGRRPGQEAVFAELRPKLDPGHLQTDTLRGRLRRYLKAFLPAEDAERYSLHSLRKGGASLAASRGVPLRQIKQHGRWRSDAVFLYTLVSDAELTAVSRLVVDQICSAAA